MAGTIGEIILSLRGDTKDWETSLGTAEKSLKKLVSETQKAGQDLGKFNTQNINLLSGWKNEIGDAYRNFASSLEPVKQGLVDQGKALSVTQKGINTLAIEELNAVATGKDFQKNLDDISSSAWVLTMGLKQLGVGLTAAFTLPLAGIASISLKTFADWETGTKNLQASADMTSAEADKMTASFRELALVMPLTVNELLQIAQTAAEAGVSTQGLEAYTIAIGKLVTVSKELSLKTAAEALVSVSKAFGIAENNVERVASVIRKMAKESRGGMDDFASSLLRAVPAASVLGLSLENVSAMLAAIIPVSGTATRAGTELTTMFDQMAINLPKLAGQMNITQEALTEMINRDAVGTLQTYVKQLGVSANQVEKNAAILEIFGSTGAKALRGLISQYDVFLDRQAEATQAFKDGTELTKDYNIASNTLANTFKRFKSSVLEVAKVIGDDLNNIIGPVLEKAIKMVSLLASLWVGLPKPIKEAVITFAALLAVLGPVILAFNTFISIGAGLITSLDRIAKVGKALKLFFVGLPKVMGVAGAGFGAIALAAGKFILIAAAVVAAVVLIYKALDKLFNITEKLKKALGLQGVEDRFNEIKDKINGTLGSLGDTTEEAAKKVKDSLTGMAILAMDWGDKVMLGFLKGFTEADFGVLDDSLKVFESYFAILEKQGKLSTEQMLNNTLEARRALAKAITEAKSLGEITSGTQAQISNLIGSARTNDVVNQILAEVKVSQIQETIDALNKEIKNRKDSLQKQTDVIDDAIKAEKKSYDARIKIEDDQIKILEKRKKAEEKSYKEQVKILQGQIDAAEKEKILAKDTLDVIKENNDVFIESLKEQKDALQENVDSTKQTLQELEDLRKSETDAAEGMLDYAKMNLESAQNRLKKEVALGKDEYDIMAMGEENAITGVNAAQDQVDLAYANYIKTKQLYTKEEKVLKAQLKTEQTAVDAADDKIDTAEKAADKQEKLYQAQVDAAQDVLDASKDALDTYKDAYSEQADSLQEEIDIRKEMVSDLQDARDEIVDKLTNERDMLQEKYDDETKIMEDRVNNAQNSLDDSKKLLDAQKGINDQWLAIEKERIAAAQDLTGGTAFPGIALDDVASSVEGLDLLNSKLDDTKSKLDDLETTAPNVFDKIGESWKSGSWIDNFNESMKNFDPADSIGRIIRETDWKQLFKDIGTGIKNAFESIDWQGIKEGLDKAIKNVDWLKVADTMLQIMFPPYFILRVILAAFGIDWEAIEKWLEDTVSQVDWSQVGKVILGTIFPPYGLLLILTDVFGIDWNKIKDDIVNTVNKIDWTAVGKTILGLLFPPLGIFFILTEVFNIDWNKVKDDIVNFVKQVDWGQVGSTILGALFSGPIAIGNLATNIYNSIVSGLETLGPDLENIGTWIGEKIASGISGTKDFFKNASGAISGLWDGINEKWSDISALGKQVGTQMASGISGAVDSVKNNSKNVLGGLWNGANDKWNEIWELGKQVGSQLGSGLSGAWDNIKNNASNIANAVGSGLQDKWTDFASWGKQAMQNVANGITSAWDIIREKAKSITGALYNGFVYDRWNDFWDWGKSVATHVAEGITGAYDKIKSAASWMADIFKSFLGWFSPPEEGPMSTGDKWMPNMIKTLTKGIMGSMPVLQKGIDTVGNTIMGIQDLNPQPVIGTQFAQGSEGYTTGVAAPSLALAPANQGGQAGATININPGMMIASKGEIRSFVRLLEGYSATEASRTGI